MEKDSEKNRQLCRAYYRANKAAAIERAKKWAAEHPERRKDLHREWRRRNYVPGDAESKRAEVKRVGEWQRNNKAKVTARNRRWAANNADKLAAIGRNWRQANPQKCREYRQQRRALELGAFVETIDRDAVYARDCGICGICKTPVDKTDFHIDHVVALANGGPHCYANVQTAHPKCNLRKSSKASLAPLQTLRSISFPP